MCRKSIRVKLHILGLEVKGVSFVPFGQEAYAEVLLEFGEIKARGQLLQEERFCSSLSRLTTLKVSPFLEEFNAQERKRWLWKYDRKGELFL